MNILIGDSFFKKCFLPYLKLLMLFTTLSDDNDARILIIHLSLKHQRIVDPSYKTNILPHSHQADEEVLSRASKHKLMM